MALYEALDPIKILLKAKLVSDKHTTSMIIATFINDQFYTFFNMVKHIGLIMVLIEFYF